MHFIMTSFMYPLDTEMRQRFLGKLYFDNPRTTEEVNYVAERLRKMNLSTKPSFADREGLLPEGYTTLMTIYQYFYKNNSKDILVQGFDKKYGRLKNIYKKFARMWVIIRSEDVFCEEDTKGKFGIFRENEDDVKLCMVNDIPLSASAYNQEKINDYFAFISFMLGDGHLSNNLINEEYSFIAKPIHDIFIRLMVMSSIRPKDKDRYNYPYGIFSGIEPLILELSKRIGEKYLDKKFLFLCKKIHYIFNMYSINKEMAFVELVSIIEMFLTHNPDSKRFNIEDSINKQFVGKMSMILYENNKELDIEKLKKELKFAYSIRSNIAHGDFSGLEKNLNGLFSFYGLKRDGKGIDYKNNDDALYQILDKTMQWVKIIINLYLTDETKLELIKNI